MAISDYATEHHIAEKADELPEVGWKALKGVTEAKYASALKDYSEEEKNKLEAELRRRTLESNARLAKAEADKKESEARISQITEMDARITLFDKLKAHNAIPIWNDNGDMTVVRVLSDFNWDELQNLVFRTGELPTLKGIRQETTRPELESDSV
jgi:hypothetical protein